jgi:hypothetical protein
MAKKYTLTVPIDLSAVPDAKGSVKVAVLGRGVKRQIKTVNIEKTGSVSFDFDELPRGLTVHLGPATAEDDQIDKLRTLQTTVATDVFLNKNAVTIPAIRISATDWHWWLVWCRTFVIRGHVLCPDGSPVPGATVCASDVDWFWWWRSKQQIGCATTDEHGAFEMKFTWCCGWWPWYWWHLRTWELDLDLARRLQPTIPVELREFAALQPSPKPDLRYLEGLISGAGFTSLGTAFGSPAKTSLEPQIPIDFVKAEAIRKKVTDRLRAGVELRIWPWFPWNPWSDCNPDIIFRVTQPCGGTESTVIVDEGYNDTRWNVGTTTNVTLVANDKACCERPVPCEGTDCIELTHACGFPRADIGGNNPAFPTPAGYANPNVATPPSTILHRPFSDTITITGTTDCLGHLDYYEFEFFDGTNFVPMPPGAMLGFNRSYFTTGPFLWHFGIGFGATLIDGHLVYETRQHYEATHPGTSPFHWMDNRDLLGIWSTGPSGTTLTWADGTYRIRIKGYNDAGGGHLTAVDLPPCDPRDPRNELTLTIDNRLVGAAFHPATHPCGSPNYVHICTREPDTDILAVRIIRPGGTELIVPCGLYEYGLNDRLEIDFYVYDPDGHLGGWTLDATFGLSEISHLTGAGTLLALPGVPGIPAAPQLVSNYRDALSAVPTPATPPTWRGGAYRLTLTVAETHANFPKPCCYQLELRASKRTVVACSSTTHDNLTEYSFMLGGCPPREG